MRLFVEFLVINNIKFLFIGPNTAFTSNIFYNTFRLNRLWFGYNEVKHFVKPDGRKVQVACYWYTNLAVNRVIESVGVILTDQEMKALKRYDNYDAIDIKSKNLFINNCPEKQGVPIS